jgi:hypothetical protein
MDRRWLVPHARRGFVHAMPAPRGRRKSGPHGLPLSDDFATLELGRRWNFFKPGADEARRARVADHWLHLAARHGTGQFLPLLLIAGDRPISSTARSRSIPRPPPGCCCSMTRRSIAGWGSIPAVRHPPIWHGAGTPGQSPWRPMRLRVRNDRHISSRSSPAAMMAAPGSGLTGMEVSGYHHNVRGGFLMLRPGLYAAGREARFRDFRFRALD